MTFVHAIHTPPKKRTRGTIFKNVVTLDPSLSSDVWATLETDFAGQEISRYPLYMHTGLIGAISQMKLHGTRREG